MPAKQVVLTAAAGRVNLQQKHSTLRPYVNMGMTPTVIVRGTDVDHYDIQAPVSNSSLGSDRIREAPH